MSKPESYRDRIPRTRCANCKHCFTFYEYEEEYKYFCMYGSTGERPLCGSVYMGENWENLDDAAWDAAEKKWNNFAKGKDVEEYGICDKYEKEIEDASPR